MDNVQSQAGNSTRTQAPFVEATKLDVFAQPSLDWDVLLPQAQDFARRDEAARLAEKKRRAEEWRASDSE